MVYTPAKTLSAGSVVSDNYTFRYDNDTEVKSVIYYPEQNLVKLTVEAIPSKANRLLELTSAGLIDTEGVSADENVMVHLEQENDIEYNTVSIESYTFTQNGVPVLDVSDKNGIMTNIRIANASANTQTGIAKVYDGDVLCGECSYSVKNDGIVQLIVDTSLHKFTANGNVTITIN